MTEREPVADDELAGLFTRSLSFPLALAVSGGADSMALMLLVWRWITLRGVPSQTPDGRASVLVLTVDHGLRAGSAADAVFVCAAAGRLGFRSAALAWEGEKPATAIQNAARSARYRLMHSYLAREGGGTTGVAPEPVRPLVTAHHQDDQAETVFMRLARGSGLDGLAGMRVRTDVFGLDVRRPLLNVPKSRLVATLEAAGQRWVEDPSNENPAFERVRWRQALSKLQPLGLSSEHIAASVARLRRASDALDCATWGLARAAGLDIHAGAYASYDAGRAKGAPEELSIRLLGWLLAHFGGQQEPASLAAVEELDSRLRSGKFETCTLGGCIVARRSDRVEVFREPGREGLATVALEAGRSTIWDHRFRVRAAVADAAARPLSVGPLGDAGWRFVRQRLRPDQRVPHRAAVTVPAFLIEDRIVAVPTLGFFEPPWSSGDVTAEFIWPVEADRANWLGS
ncbi:MAG: tRNA lysidine(34) synthetase TilS [Hyphomicrobium sp.]